MSKTKYLMLNMSFLIFIVLVQSAIFGQNQIVTKDKNLKIVLDKKAGVITISLKNTGEKPVSVIVNNYIQSPKLILVNQAGDTIYPFDPRSKMVFDANPYCHMVQIIPPEASIHLGTINEDSVNQRKTFDFGRYRFENLLPGTYTAVAQFESRYDKCAAKKDGKQRPIKNVWLGMCESEAFQLDIR